MSLSIPSNQGQGQQQMQGQQQVQGGQMQMQAQGGQGQAPSTRAMQQGVSNRVDGTGQPMEKPRLAGPRRKKTVGGIAKNAVKKKAKNWLIGAAFGGTISGAGFGLSWIL